MDIEEQIRFQVLSEVFTDTTPTPANIGPTGRRKSAADATAANDLAANSTKIPPYALTVGRATHLPDPFYVTDVHKFFFLSTFQGSIAIDGLGPVSWWGGQ